VIPENSAGQSNQMKTISLKMRRLFANDFRVVAILLASLAASSISGSVRAQSQPPPPPPPATGESSSKNPPETAGAEAPPPKTDAEKDLAALPAMDRLAAVKDIEIGTYYMNKGNLDAAIDRLRDAAVSYPTYAEPWRLMGQAYEKKGNLAEAIKCDQQYLKLYPHAQIRKKLEAHIEELQKKLDRESQKRGAK
jgi:tetratricopeptide (TPR) repeat protein